MYDYLMIFKIRMTFRDKKKSLVIHQQFVIAVSLNFSLSLCLQTTPYQSFLSYLYAFQKEPSADLETVMINGVRRAMRSSVILWQLSSRNYSWETSRWVRKCDVVSVGGFSRRLSCLGCFGAAIRPRIKLDLILIRHTEETHLIPTNPCIRYSYDRNVYVTMTRCYSLWCIFC